MSKPHILEALIKWSDRDEWAAHFDNVFEAHVGAALDSFDLDFEGLAKVLGDANADNVWGCAFEDFLTRPRDESDELTIVDDYLKRRGWKESASKKRYIRAMGDSLMGLYEVVAVVPGQSMVLRDLIFGDADVEVKERSATRFLLVSDRLAARVVRLLDGNQIGGGVLIFEAGDGDEEFGNMAQEWHKLRDELANNPPPNTIGREAETIEFIRLAMQFSLAPMLTQIWLEEQLSARMERPPEPSRNSDGDDIELHTITFPLQAGITAARVEARLNMMPNLRLDAEEEGIWHWIDSNSAEVQSEPAYQNVRRAGDQVIVELEDGTSVLGTMELVDDLLIVAVNSKRRADLAKVMINAALGPMLGRPVTEVQSVDDILAELDAAEEEILAEPEEDLAEDVRRSKTRGG